VLTARYGEVRRKQDSPPVSISHLSSYKTSGHALASNLKNFVMSRPSPDSQEALYDSRTVQLSGIEDVMI